MSGVDAISFECALRLQELPMNTLPRKHVIAALTACGAVLVTALPSAAQSGRPNSTTMSCGQAQSMINQRGAVVMSTGRYTFDRYVANRSFCQHGEVTRRDYIPTKDNAKCYVLRCVNPQPWRYD
jgi:hypothetical protein